MARSFSQKLQELRRVAKLHADWIIYATLGESALTKAELDALRSYKKLPMTDSLNLVDTSYTLGRLRAILRSKDYKQVSYEEAVEKQAALQLSPVEELAIEHAKLNAGQHFKVLASKIEEGTFSSLSTSIGAAVAEATVQQTVATETALALAYKKTAQELASTLASKLLSQHKTNWTAVAKTEMHAAKISGVAQAIANKVDIYANSDGVDSDVSVVPGTSCCSDCTDKYTTNGTPKVFKLKQLMSAGSNTDSGVTHEKKNGKHTNWKATLPPLHPSCGCQLVFIPSGYGWNSGKLEVVNKSLFDEFIQKATAGVSGGISSVVKPQGAPSNAKEKGTPSIPGAAAPGNSAGPGRPPGLAPKPGSGTPGGAGGGPQYVPCPFGGGADCVKHGGNGATTHKGSGSIMKKHQEAMANGAEPKTPEAKEAQTKQAEANAAVYNTSPHKHAVVVKDLSSGEIASERALGEGEKGATDSFKISIKGNGSGAMKKPVKVNDEYYHGFGNITDGLQGLPNNSSHINEEASYHLAMSLGLTNHVPVTVLRTHDEHGPTSVQQWKEGHVPFKSKLDSYSDDQLASNGGKISTFLKNVPAEKRDAVEQKFHEVAVLDIVQNNNDRHFDNLAFGDDDFYAIDNGLTHVSGLQGQKNCIHYEMHKEGKKLKVPDHLQTKFKAQSLETTMRSMEDSGLQDWQVMQNHLRMKYVAHLQETHGHIPIEATRFVSYRSESGDEQLAEYVKNSGMPMFESRLGPAGGFSERDRDKRNSLVAKLHEDWELPDQRFARFTKDYVSKLDPESFEAKTILSAKPLHAPGTAWKHGGPEGDTARAQYWDSIPAYEPLKVQDEKIEESSPIRVAAEIPSTRHNPIGEVKTQVDANAKTALANSPQSDSNLTLKEKEEEKTAAPKRLRKSLVISSANLHRSLTSPEQE